LARSAKDFAADFFGEQLDAHDERGGRFANRSERHECVN
jgi:hypothetical protein